VDAVKTGTLPGWLVGVSLAFFAAEDSET